VQHRQRSAAPHLDVNPASKLLPLERHLDGHFVVAFGFVDADDDLAMHIRSDRHGRAEHRFVQSAGGGKDGVADRLSLESLNRFVPVKAVFRIARFAS